MLCIHHTHKARITSPRRYSNSRRMNSQRQPLNSVRDIRLGGLRSTFKGGSGLPGKIETTETRCSDSRNAQLLYMSHGDSALISVRVSCSQSQGGRDNVRKKTNIVKHRAERRDFFDLTYRSFNRKLLWNSCHCRSSAAVPIAASGLSVPVRRGLHTWEHVSTGHSLETANQFYRARRTAKMRWGGGRCELSFGRDPLRGKNE